MNLLRLGVLTLIAFAAGNATAGTVTEWEVPWDEGRPRDPYLDSKGKVWFCGQGGAYLARLDPATGEFLRFELGAEKGPHNLIIDANDRVWYAGNTTGHIGRLDPASGKIAKVAMPDPAARDPHTLIWDQTGNIWFTVQQGNFIGHLDVTTATVQLVKVATPAARPYGIVVAPNHTVWVVLFGTNRLATVDPKTMTVAEIELPDKDSRPRRLAVTSDGAVWYGDYSRGMLGRYTPQDGKFREWPLPGGASSWPYAMAGDDQDRLWLAESGSVPNRIVGFDPKSEQFFYSAEIPSGGGTLRHMIFHAGTRSLWFGADTGTVGRVLLPE